MSELRELWSALTSSDHVQRVLVGSLMLIILVTLASALFLIWAFWSFFWSMRKSKGGVLASPHFKDPMITKVHTSGPDALVESRQQVFDLRQLLELREAHEKTLAAALEQVRLQLDEAEQTIARMKKGDTQ